MDRLRSGGNSSTDLLSDTLMMDDFAPDIDLLDDILGVDYDWKELEPSLSTQPHLQPQQQLQFAPQMQNGLFTNPDFEQGLAAAAFEQDLKPLLLPTPASVAKTQVPVHTQGQPILIPNFGALQPQTQQIATSAVTTTPQYIQPAPAPTPVTTEGSKILTQILPNNGNQNGNKVFSFTTAGFCQPVFATATSTANGQTIILPQLQLLVQPDQQQQHQDKLPMKRLASSNSFSSSNDGKEPCGSTSGSKRSKSAKEQTTRRSSHNAIERRYRSSINDKIIELKNLVCHNSTDSEKVHKAAILRNSIDTIRYLKNSNSRLDKENQSLKTVLNQAKKCHNCGVDQPIAVFGSFAAANSNSDLRGLLTDNSPPTTDLSSDSSNPGTPNSMIDEGSQNPRNKANASPIALFAIAAGLFLINPGSHHPTTHVESDNGVHSRVERSIDYIPNLKPTFLDMWTPRLIAVAVNLVLFLAIWYLSDKLFHPRRPLKSKKQKSFSKYTMEYVDITNKKLVRALKLNSKSNSEDKLESLESVIEEVTGKRIPNCNLSLRFQNLYLLFKTPFLQSCEQSDEDTQIDYIVGKCYVEIGKDSINEKLAAYCGLKSLEYGFNCVETKVGQDLLISAVMLTKSKIVLKSLLMKVKNCKNINKNVHPLLDSAVGLGFFRQNLAKEEISSDGVEPTKLCTLTTCMTPVDPLSRLVNKYKYEMMWNGVSQLFYYGEGAVDYFKNAVRGVIAERKGAFSLAPKNSGVSESDGILRNRRGMMKQQSTVDEGFDMESDLNCEWWACLLWSQAEWMSKGGRGPVLQRLYKVVDSLWKYQMDDPLCRAVYYTHMAKRLLLKDGHSVSLNAVRRLVDSAGEGLRDAINVTTDKPKPVVQLIWTLTAEWILEIRLELWEELNSSTDVEFTRQFSRDLDTLRSLTHYVPSSLPSVYLYEASMRLMTKASPGRTQQLLDASLRSVRLNQRSGLICNNNHNAALNLMNLDEDLLAEKSNNFNSEGELNCNRMIRKNGKNLIREKRKAIALYLRCKHLPTQVMTCPGEKAGMLREALKCLEIVGDSKKINECLDMMKSLQSVALY